MTIKIFAVAVLLLTTLAMAQTHISPPVPPLKCPKLFPCSIDNPKIKQETMPGPEPVSHDMNDIAAQYIWKNRKGRPVGTGKYSVPYNVDVASLVHNSTVPIYGPKGFNPDQVINLLNKYPTGNTYPFVEGYPGSPDVLTGLGIWILFKSPIIVKGERVWGASTFNCDVEDCPPGSTIRQVMMVLDPNAPTGYKKSLEAHEIGHAMSLGHCYECPPGWSTMRPGLTQNGVVGEPTELDLYYYRRHQDELRAYREWLIEQDDLGNYGILPGRQEEP